MCGEKQGWEKSRMQTNLRQSEIYVGQSGRDLRQLGIDNGQSETDVRQSVTDVGKSSYWMGRHFVKLASSGL